MKKVAIWGWHTPSAVAAIGELKRRRRLEVVAWFGEAHDCTHDLNEFLHQFKVGDRRYSGAAKGVYREVYRCLPEFMQIYSRVSYSMGRTFQETLHIFNVYVDFFADLLAGNKVELVLFSNLPHFGVDFLLYKVARALGIETVMMNQSLIPNRFFYVSRMEDFGSFEGAEPCPHEPALTVERAHGKDLAFYMSNLPRQKKCCVASLANDLLHLVVLKKKKPMTLAGAVQKFQIGRAFNRRIDREPTTDVDLGRKFVYFPLQLQPELTTSVLGGIYTDQLLAIERLREMLPADWYIYAKENPKQTQRERDDLFYQRLKAIDKLVYVHTSLNTYALIENCQFVATITGTAGWEAVSGGKCALVFGKAWYKNLPGVFEYHENMTLDQIMDCRIDHDELVRRYNEVASKTAPGVIDPSYIPLVPGYTDESNAKLLEAFANRFL